MQFDDQMKVIDVVRNVAFHLNVEEALMPLEEMSFACEMDRPASGQRVLSVEVTEKERLYELSEDDYEVLLRIVEAEAGGEDEEGKMPVEGPDS